LGGDDAGTPSSPLTATDAGEKPSGERGRSESAELLSISMVWSEKGGEDREGSRASSSAGGDRVGTDEKGAADTSVRCGGEPLECAASLWLGEARRGALLPTTTASSLVGRTITTEATAAWSAAAAAVGESRRFQLVGVATSPSSVRGPLLASPTDGRDGPRPQRTAPLAPPPSAPTHGSGSESSFVTPVTVRVAASAPAGASSSERWRRRTETKSPL